MRAETTSDTSDRDGLAACFGAMTLAAAVPIMNMLDARPAQRRKADASVVTDADVESERIILAALKRFLPDISIVSEEQAASEPLTQCGPRFLLVDPLDGTREYLAGNGEFTINIALVENYVPIVGAVFAPARRRLWLGGATARACNVEAGAPLPSSAAFHTVATRQPPKRGLTALVSRSHREARTDAWLAQWPVAETLSMGSSLKLCVIAEGGADVSPRFGPTMEWDTAAAQAVLIAAGGAVVDAAGHPLRYGKRDTGLRNDCFVGWGRMPNIPLSST